MKINFYPNISDPGVCWLCPGNYVYLGDDEYGFPIYGKEEPYIGFNPINIIKYSKELDINSFEYLYFAILHEIGHYIHGEYENTLEEEVMAWRYAMLIDPSIPNIVVISALATYV